MTKELDRPQPHQPQPTNIQNFDDGSGIVCYDDGTMLLHCKPFSVLEGKPPVPQAYLHYWQVIHGCPDEKTWDDIKKENPKVIAFHTPRPQGD